MNFSSEQWRGLLGVIAATPHSQAGLRATVTGSACGHCPPPTHSSVPPRPGCSDPCYVWAAVLGRTGSLAEVRCYQAKGLARSMR